MVSTSCQLDNVIYSETLSNRAERALRAEMPDVKAKESLEAFDLLKQSAALLFVNEASGLPDTVFFQLRNRVRERITQMRFFTKLLNPEEMDRFFANKRNLKQLKDIYLEGLTAVSVSNKDISSHLGKRLKIENLIVFQIDQWPCGDCEIDTRMIMKLRVVDAESGFIVWTGIIERYELTRQKTDELPTLALHQAEELLDIFHSRFRKKWHTLRYKNLALISTI